MRDLAPDIVRQRLLIEGLFDIEVDGATVERYLIELAAHLNLRTYGKPIVHAPGGAGKDENEGFDAFIPLIDSGFPTYGGRSFSPSCFTQLRFERRAAPRANFPGT
jgi:S-adenosylmethionine decarboxylase